MSVSIPSEMRVLALENYHEDLTRAIQSLRVTTKPTPSPGPGQVLVRMEAAPCNPSDLVFLQGLYGVKKILPAAPGWEGAGTVVTSGGGIMATVMVFGGKSWPPAESCWNNSFCNTAGF